MIFNYKKKRPLFTIITAVYNGERYIEQTIKSVLNQKFKNFEYIIIDGKSTDKTMEIVNKYKNKVDLIISKKDKNLWDALNKGIKLSRGKIIAIINSDDKYNSNALKIASNYFSIYPKIDFFFGAVKKTKWGFKNIQKIYHGFYPKKILYKFNIYPSHSIGFFIKKKSHLRVGYYDTNLEYGSDYDFFYRMIVKYKMLGIASKKNESLGTFRPGGMSEKLPWIKILLIESKIRIKNNQNFIFVILLFLLNLLNRFKYKVIGIFR